MTSAEDQIIGKSQEAFSECTSGERIKHELYTELQSEYKAWIICPWDMHSDRSSNNFLFILSSVSTVMDVIVGVEVVVVAVAGTVKIQAVASLTWSTRRLSAQSRVEVKRIRI
jgi:hypothetical protein